MEKYNIITNTESEIDQIVEELISHNRAPENLENTTLNNVKKLVNYRPESKNMVTFELTQDEVELLKNDKRIILIEKVDNTPLSLDVQQVLSVYKIRDISNVSFNVGIGTDDVSWGLARIATLSATRPWSNTYTYYKTGENVDVVVFDTGVEKNHPEWLDDNGNTRLQEIDWTLYYPVTSQTTLNVGGNNTGDPNYYYVTINGVDNDTVYVISDHKEYTRSETYSFNVSLPGSLPSTVTFVITDSLGIPLDTPQCTNNAINSGTVQLNIDTSSNSLYYYRLSNLPAGVFSSTGVISRTKYNSQHSLFYSDSQGHGTHCTGIAAGSAFGTAINSKIYNMHLNFQDSFGNWYDQYGLNATSDGIIEAYDLLINWHNSKPLYRPTVTSHSYGFAYSIQVIQLNQKVKEVTDNGIHYCHSAGNNGSIIKTPGQSAYTTRRESSPCYPDTWTNQKLNNPVITVGALGDRSGIYEPYPEHYIGEYSNYGSGVSIFAPGSFIVSSLANVDGGTGVPYVAGSSFYKGKKSGTSMACPLVAGVLACILEDYPNLTPQQAKNFLLENGQVGTFRPERNQLYGDLSQSIFDTVILTINQYPAKKILINASLSSFNCINFNNLCYTFANNEQINIANNSTYIRLDGQTQWFVNSALNTSTYSDCADCASY